MAAREPIAVQPTIACQNRRGFWLYKGPLCRRILDFFEESNWGVQLIARPGTQYSFHISGNRGYDSNRVSSLSIFHSYCVERHCMGTSTIMPCYDTERLKTKIHVGLRPRGINRMHQAQGQPWPGCRPVKLIPGINILWTDQVKEGLEQCWSSEPIRLLI